MVQVLGLPQSSRVEKSSQLQTCSASAIEAIWEVSLWMEDLPLTCPFICNSTFHIIKNKPLKTRLFHFKASKQTLHTASKETKISQVQSEPQHALFSSFPISGTCNMIHAISAPVTVPKPLLSLSPKIIT